MSSRSNQLIAPIVMLLMVGALIGFIVMLIVNTTILCIQKIVKIARKK